MPKLYLVNAFSPSMIPTAVGKEVELTLKRIDLTTARRMIARRRKANIDCAIGHSSTAFLAGVLLGINPKSCSRKMIALARGDKALILTLTFRPPEGKVYTYKEMVKLYKAGKVGLWVLHRRR